MMIVTFFSGGVLSKLAAVIFWVFGKRRRRSNEMASAVINSSISQDDHDISTLTISVKEEGSQPPPNAAEYRKPFDSNLLNATQDEKDERLNAIMEMVINQEKKINQIEGKIDKIKKM